MRLGVAVLVIFLLSTGSVAAFPAGDVRGLVTWDGAPGSGSGTGVTAGVAPPALPDIGAVGLGIVQADCGGLGDAGDSQSAARGIAAPAACVGDFGLRDSADYYRMAVREGEVVLVERTAGLTSSSSFCLHRPDGSKVGCGSSRIRWTAEAAGDWSLAILATDENAWKRYGFELTVTMVPTENDCGTGRDAGGDRRNASSATPISTISSCLGGIHHTFDPIDVLAIDFAEGEAVTITLSKGPGSVVRACLFDYVTQFAVECFNEYSDSGRRYWMASAPRLYVLVVEALSSSGSTDYRIDVRSVEPHDDCGGGRDASSGQPVVLSSSLVECAGELDYANGDEKDIFEFPEARALRLDLEFHGKGAVYFCAHVVSVLSSCATVASGERVSFPVQAPATHSWRLSIWGFAPGSGAYALRVEAFEPRGQSDCGSGRDAAPNQYLVALPEGGLCEAELVMSEGDYSDWYSIASRAQGEVEIEIRLPEGASARVCYRNGAESCIEVHGEATWRRPIGLERVAQLNVAYLDRSWDGPYVIVARLPSESG
ncbi:MAG TPA: hypothetical protein VM889_12790 [Candidatus Thermoplasmatota archaeon]|nr:hypothetical protein [Candidatus Thermoplasmatota archaeon]